MSIKAVNMLWLRDKLKMLFVAGSWVLVIVLLFLYHVKSQELNRLKTMETGRVIADAIEAYIVDHTEMPVRLNDLVPAYIDEVSAPSWGDTGWLYKTYQDQRSFSLGVGYKVDEKGSLPYPSLWYNLDDKRWSYDS